DAYAFQVLYGHAFCAYVFFFQAEDGIRDFHVTGVQTCALPIFWPMNPVTHFENRSAIQCVTGFIGQTPDKLTTTLGRGGSDYTRSEERRVGKECRSRWTEYQ